MWHVACKYKRSLPLPENKFLQCRRTRIKVRDKLETKTYRRENNMRRSNKTNINEIKI
jgi:hypothetical protein